MKIKPDLSFWKLWNLSFGFFGVQIAYALQSANVSRIFATIGADPHDLSYFWILPPLMGMIVQPVVGTFSDRTWTRFGRRLPYLIVGAVMAVIVMCLLPNAGSFGLTVSGAILMGIIALMMLDTSINMAMQPFKMLVGDMVNEKQKGKAYSIQSFLCNAGSIVGYVFPFLLAWVGISSVAPEGEVPQSVIWSFYLGAAILISCVIYSLIKIKEWPPKLYNEYNGVEETREKAPKTNLIKLLVHAPRTFWTVSLVQFFCWFAFLFMWTYTTGTVATKVFDTPTVDHFTGFTLDGSSIEAKHMLIGDSTVAMEGGRLTIAGVKAGGQFYPASLLVAGSDTLVANHVVQATEAGNDKVQPGRPIDASAPVLADGKPLPAGVEIVPVDYLSIQKGPYTLTTADVMARDRQTGELVTEETETYQVQNPADLHLDSNVVLNTASKPYNEAGDWVGILFAIQAVGSVLWAMFLPRIGSRKFSYALSLALGAAGFILVAFITNKWLLFIPFLMIGCAWAAMLAWPFTIVTNSLKGGNIGAYLGLFNCSITIPQIIGALAGGWLLHLFSTAGEIAPQYMMMILAGIALGIGTVCVFFIREKSVEGTVPKEDIADSETL